MTRTTSQIPITTAVLVAGLVVALAAAAGARAQTAPDPAPPPDQPPPPAAEAERALLEQLGMDEASLEVSADDFRYQHAPFEMQVRLVREPGRLNPYREYRLEFPTTLDSPYPENNTAYGVWFEPVGGAVRVVFLLPYWGGTDLSVERFLARQLVRRGYSACIMPLAYQFDRAPVVNGTRVRSGHYTVSADMKRTRASWIQSARDVQRATWWFKQERGYRQAGLWGISLGAHVASVIYSVSPEYDAAVICMAGGNLHEMIWNDSVETREIKADLIAQGVTFEALKKGMRYFDPTYYAAQVGARRRGVLMVAGTKDEIVPPHNVRALAAAYGNPEVIWVPGTHVGTMILLLPNLPKVLAHLERAFDQAAGIAPAAPDAAPVPAGRDEEEF